MIWNGYCPPGIIFSIRNPLTEPAWAEYHGLEANTLTEENSLGSVFLTDQRVSPLMTREKM